MPHSPQVVARRMLIAVALLFVVSAAVFATAHTRSEWITQFDTLDASVNSGLGYSAYDDSSTLAWAESYILRAYLNMYEGTGDTDYLDAFVTHMDTIVGNMDDGDNDGYDGWDTMRYAVNMVPNPGAEEVDPNQNVPTTLIMEDDFETPSGGDATLPDGWVRWQSSSSTAYLDSSVKYAGTYGLTVETYPAGGWQVIERTISYEAGKNYCLSFMGKVSGTGAVGRASLYDSTDSATLCTFLFSDTTWTEQKVYFTAPSEAGHTVKIRLYHNDYQVADTAAHFDDLEYNRVDGNLLPDGWVRWQSTADTAYRDMENAYLGNASFALVADPNAGWQVLQRDLENELVDDNHAYEPGITYWVYFVAKTDGGAAGGRLTIYDYTASQTLYDQTFTNTSWQAFSGSFTAPAAANHVIRIRLLHSTWNQEGTAYFDDIRVQQYAEYAVHDGMLAMPMAKFVKMVYRGQAPSSYTDAADYYLAALDDHLMPKWESCLEAIDASKSVYVQPDDGSLAWPNNSLPHNQYLALAEAYAYLAQALDGQDAADYRAKAGKLTAAFKSKLTLVTGDAYEWNYYDPLLVSDYVVCPGVEDTSHGNIDIATAITAYRAGITFDATDMGRFTNTLLDNMWNGNSTTPTIGCRVDTTIPNANQYTTYAWIRLGQFDRTVYDVIRTMHDNIWDDSELMTWRQLTVISHIVKGVLLFDEWFETAASGDSTLPDGWVRWQSTSSTTYLDSSNPFEGDNGLTVETYPAGGWQVIQRDIDYTPGSVYQLKFMGKAGNANVGGRAEVLDVGVSNLGTTTFTNSDWEQKTLTFTAPAATGHTLRIRLYTSAYNVADGIVHFDNVEVREIN